MRELSIRAARLDEAELVAALITELAEQQGDPTEHISVEAFRRDAFRPSPEFEVLLAEVEGAVVGYALFHPSYEPSYSARGVYLCDLYVRPAARRKGIGRALAAAVARRSKELGRSYVWWVTKRWNEPALAFYRALGAVTTEVIAHSLTFDKFEALAAEDGAMPPSSGKSGRASVNLYPEVAPYDHGMLDVGEGHRVYWEACGNPSGKPALVLHGGPGSGCTPGWRRYFSPDLYRVVLFDQRGSGRSTPHASEPNIDLATNTTHHLLADIELLRRHLTIERWLLLGASWGSTLALAYAERHPEHVTEIVLEGIATTSSSEIDWITRGVGAFFPDAWARFRDGVPEPERSGNLVDAYHRLLMHPDPAIHQKAARDWCDWEIAIVKLHADDPPNPRYEDPRFRLGFARLVTHYWRHAAWLEDGCLLRDSHRLAGIPGILVHGRLDLGSPLSTAWHLAQCWPGSELIAVDQAGHDAGHQAIAAHIVAATDRFAKHT